MLNVEERPAPAQQPASAASVASVAPVAAPPAAEPAIEIPERPGLAADVQLAGVIEGTGFQTRQWLVQRGGDYLQLSELLYRVIEQMDGERTIEEIAARVAEQTGRPVSANNVRYLMEKRFIPLGLIAGVAELDTPEAKKAKARRAAASRGPLQLSLKIGFIGPRPIEAGARWLQHLYWPPVLIAVLVLAAVGQGWLFLVHGIGSTIQAVLDDPVLLLPVSTYVVLSAIFHEYGHASALRYGGGRARGMGFGLYFTFPAFYTDCTDSYRLGRWAKLRIDMGGIYFDIINTVVLMGLYALTHQPMLLAAVMLLDLEMLDQFDPIMRFDGYWALADLVGVPDFYVFMTPVLRSMLPKRFRPKGQAAPPLKGWVKLAFLGYTLFAVPAVFVTFAMLLAFFPLFLVTYWNSLVLQWLDFADAWIHHDTGGALIGAVQVAILLLTVYFLSFAVYGLVRSITQMLWKLLHATRRERAAGWLLSGVVALFFAFFWLPQVTAIGEAVIQLAAANAQTPGATQGVVLVPRPIMLPSPGSDGTSTRDVPNEQGVADASPKNTPNGTASGASSGAHTGGASGGQASSSHAARPVSDPNAKADPGTNRSGSGHTSHPSPKPQPQPQPTPKPKPKRTPPPGFPTPPPPPSMPAIP